MHNIAHVLTLVAAALFLFCLLSSSPANGAAIPLLARNVSSTHSGEAELAKGATVKSSIVDNGSRTPQLIASRICIHLFFCSILAQNFW